MLDVRRARDESGVMMVFFAILLPLILLMGVVTIDIGNWWVHKRHLQTQVDAAALAAGPQFVGCFNDPTSANAAIASRALAYAGDTLRPGQFNPGSPAGTTNLQVQQPNDVRAVLNSTQYWASGDPTDGSTHDFTLGTPCATSFLDVKGTDDEAPLLWGLLPFVASPKARAKIEIQDIQTARGMLPWAVPEIEPRAVVAFFVNEDTGAIIDFQQLMPTTSGPAFWSNWSTALGQEQVTFDGLDQNTGIVIMVSKNDPDPGTGGTLAANCSQAPGLVTCYGGSSATSGLSFIHGYSGGLTSGTLASPQVREVDLVAIGCSAADLSAAYFTLDGNCSASVEAVLDFGVTGDPTQHPQCARVAGYTWIDDGTPLGRWTGGSVNLPAGSGRNVVSLSGTSGPRNATECGNPGQQPNSFSRSKISAPYVANSASGPVQYLQLSATHGSTGTPVGNPNSIETNDPTNQWYNYSVTVGLPKPFQIANYTDPPLMLRMASPSGSQNQAWDCDKGINFVDEIANGCQTTYIENYRDLDEDGDKEWNNILCTGYSTTNLPPTTFNPIPPEDCVITETGDKTGQLRDGLHERLETPCFPNGWPDDAAELADFVGPDGSAYGTDPRYVTLIITDDTAFQASGSDPLPIKYFAGFYVTGWDYHPTQSPGCGDPDGGGPLKGNDPHPIYGPVGSYNHNLDNGDVWGYFVDIVLFSSEGEPSGELCAFGADPAACVATLVE